MPSFCSKGLRVITINGRLKKNLVEFGERRVIDIRLEADFKRSEFDHQMSAIDVQVKKKGILFSTVEYSLTGNGRSKKAFEPPTEKKTFVIPNYPKNYDFTEKIYFYPTYYIYDSGLRNAKNRIFYGEETQQDRDGFYDNIRISGDHLQILSVGIKNGDKLNNRLLHPAGSPFLNNMTYSLDHDKIRMGDKVNILDSRFFISGPTAMWELTLQGSIKPDR